MMAMYCDGDDSGAMINEHGDVMMVVISPCTGNLLAKCRVRG